MSSSTKGDGSSYIANVHQLPSSNNGISTYSSLNRAGNSIITSTPRTALSTGPNHNVKYAYTEYSHIDTTNDNFEKPLKGLIEELRTLSTDEYKLRKEALDQKNWRSTLQFIFEKNQLDANGNAIAKPMQHRPSNKGETKPSKDGKSTVRTNNKKYIPVVIDKLPNVERMHDWSISDWKKFGEVQHRCQEQGYDLIKYMYRLPQESLTFTSDGASSTTTNNNSSLSSLPTDLTSYSTAASAYTNTPSHAVLHDPHSSTSASSHGSDHLGVIIDNSGVGSNYLQDNAHLDPRVAAASIMSPVSSSTLGMSAQQSNIQAWLWKPNSMKLMKYLYVSRINFPTLLKQLQYFLVNGRDQRNNNVVIEQHSREDLIQAEKSKGFEHDFFDRSSSNTTSGSAVTNSVGRMNGNQRQPRLSSLSGTSDNPNSNSILMKQIQFEKQQDQNLSYNSSLNKETQSLQNWSNQWSFKLSQYQNSLVNNGNNTLSGGQFIPNGYINKSKDGVKGSNNANTSGTRTRTSNSNNSNTTRSHGDMSSSAINQNTNSHDNDNMNQMTDLHPLSYSLYGHGSSLALQSAFDAYTMKNALNNNTTTTTDDGVSSGSDGTMSASMSSGLMGTGTGGSGSYSQTRTRNSSHSRRQQSMNRTTFGVPVPPSIQATLNNQSNHSTMLQVKSGLAAVISDVKHDRQRHLAERHKSNSQLAGEDRSQYSSTLSLTGAINQTDDVDANTGYTDYNMLLKTACSRLESMSEHLTLMDTPVVDSIPSLKAFTNVSKFISKATTPNPNQSAVLLRETDNTGVMILLGDLNTRIINVQRNIGSSFTGLSRLLINYYEYLSKHYQAQQGQSGLLNNDFTNHASNSSYNPSTLLMLGLIPTQQQLTTDLCDFTADEKKCLKRLFTIVVRDQTRMSRSMFKSRLLQAGLDPNLTVFADKLFRSICSSAISYLDFRDYCHAAHITLHYNPFYRSFYLYHIFDLDEDGILSVRDIFTALLMGLHKQFPHDFQLISSFMRAKIMYVNSLHHQSFNSLNTDVKDKVVCTDVIRFDNIMTQFDVKHADLEFIATKNENQSGSLRSGDGSPSSPSDTADQDDSTPTTASLVEKYSSVLQAQAKQQQEQQVDDVLLSSTESMNIASLSTTFWLANGPVLMCHNGKPFNYKTNSHLTEKMRLKMDKKKDGANTQVNSTSTTTTTTTTGKSSGAADNAGSSRDYDSDEDEEDDEEKKKREDELRVKEERERLLLAQFQEYNGEIVKIPCIKQWIHMMQSCPVPSQLTYITPMEMYELVSRSDQSDLIRLLQLSLLSPDIRNAPMNQSLNPYNGNPAGSHSSTDGGGLKKCTYPWDTLFL